MTGNLDTVLDQLAEYIDRDIEARRKVSNALMYPGIVFVFAIIAVIVITAFVLPRFKTFFAQLHAKLPLPTRMLLAIANFFTNDWYVVLAVAVALVTVAVSATVTTRGARSGTGCFSRSRSSETSSAPRSSSVSAGSSTPWWAPASRFPRPSR